MTTNPVSNLRTELLLLPVAVGFLVAVSTYIVPVIYLQTPSRTIGVFGFPIPWRSIVSYYGCDYSCYGCFQPQSGFLPQCHVNSVSRYSLTFLLVDSFFYTYVGWLVVIPIMLVGHARKTRIGWEREQRSIAALQPHGERLFCYTCDRTTNHEVRYRSNLGIIEKLLVCRMCSETVKEPVGRSL